MRFETKDLVVEYPGAAEPALRGVSMTIESGKLTAVLGPNGSGKSTLMRALLGVSHKTSGQAVVDGKPVSEWDRRELARSVGAVAQSESVAFPLTTAEMVGMGRYPHLGPMESAGTTDRAAIKNALVACDVADLANRDVATLSGGELQRARIARALAQVPRALVLDEPTASLDIRHEMAILELLRAHADAGMTVLLITHGLDMAARFADRMLLLGAGRVVAEGAPADVMDSDTLSAIYGWPIAIDTDPRSGALRVSPLRSNGERKPTDQ